MPRDFLGRLVKRDIFGKKIPKKQMKREVIAESRRKGKAGEDNYKLRAQLGGYEVERTGRGHDFKIYKRDIPTEKRRFVGYREIKSSKTAPVSKLQKKMHKKMKGKYKIIIEDNPFY